MSSDRQYNICAQFVRTFSLPVVRYHLRLVLFTICLSAGKLLTKTIRISDEYLKLFSIKKEWIMVVWGLNPRDF